MEIDKIKQLIESFDENNIDLVDNILKGSRIKKSILGEYKELFEACGYKKYSIENLKKIINMDMVYCPTETVPDILFKLPKLNYIRFSKIKNLDNLVEFDGIIIVDGSSNITFPNLKKVGELWIGHNDNENPLPNLEYVNGVLYCIMSKLKILPKLNYVGGKLQLLCTKIEELPSLKYVGGYLDLYNTPLGKKLKDHKKKVEIINGFGVQGESYCF